MKPKQIYQIEIEGEDADKLGDISKDIADELEPLVLPYGCYASVKKIKENKK